MAVIRSAGGPSGRGAYRQTWRGGTVAQQLDAAVQQVMDDKAKEILADLRTEIHEVSGEMRRQAFARVEVSGGKRSLTAGSDVDYAIFEEIRHPQIRKVMDKHIPTVPPRLKAAIGGIR